MSLAILAVLSALANPVTEASLSVTAPGVVFSGRVLERGTRAPVADAEVRAGAAAAALTGADGAFAFTELPAGAYTVIIPATGYKTFRTTETLASGEHTEVTYYLLPDDTAIDEVLVAADAAKKEVSKTVLKREEIRKVPGTNNDAVKVLTALPGVTVENELASDLLVRGSAAGENRFEIERLAIPYVFHAGGLRSVVSSELVEQVDFQTGGFPARYGRATGGVVDVRTRPGRTDRPGGSADVNTLMAEASVESPLGTKGSFVAAGRRSYFDLTLKPLMESAASEDDLQFTVFPQFYDYQLRADYRATTSSTLTALVLGADDILKMLLPRANPRDPDVTGAFYLHMFFHGQQIALKQRLSDRLTLESRLGRVVSGQTQKMGGRKVSFHVDDYQLHEDLAFRLSARHTLNAGAQVSLARFQADLFVGRVPGPQEKGVLFTDLKPIPYRLVKTLNAHGLYAEDEICITPTWTVTPGVRGDYYEQAAASAYVDPRLSTRWEMTPSTAWKAAAGRYSKFGDPQQLDRVFGSPELEPLHTVHVIGGVEHKLTRADLLSAQAFFKRFENFPFSYTTGQQYRNTLTGQAYGFELLARHQLTSRFFGWASYAYTRSERRYPDTGRLAPSDADQPHVVNAVASYKLTRRWEVGGKWRLSSGIPYTPVEDRIYLADKSIYIPMEGERNSRRIAPTHRLDARVEYSYPFETWTLRAYLEVLNVYGRKNPAATLPNYDYTSSDTMALLPVPLPMLGVRGEF